MLKKIIRSIAMLGLLCFLLSGDNNRLTVFAANLDQIRSYNITVSPYEDGSLDMTYHITWEVLDSTTEGPLEWVKIGIPNKHAEDIEALSDNIKKIGYYGSHGDFIRIHFDRKYYAGDVVEFDFRFHQHRMYRQRGNTRKYSFTPGWFDEINVDTLSIRWDSDRIQSASPEYSEDNGFYLWETSLYEGEKYTLAQFTAKYLPRNKRSVSGVCQGPRHFSYNGVSLYKLKESFLGGKKTK